MRNETNVSSGGGRRDVDQRRVAIIHLKGDFDTVPALRSTVTLLGRHGYAVDVIYARDPAFLPPRVEPGVSLVPLPRLPRRGFPTAPRRIVEMSLWLLLSLRHCTRRSYTCLIGVDPVGLIVAALVAIPLRTAIAYFSLELYLSNEISSLHIKLMKALERFFNRRCTFTIVQDQDRARLLAGENGVPLDTIVLLPNSPLGPPRRSRADYLQHELDLPKDRRLILYAGALTDWTYTPELIQAARSWPAEWTLVLHSRQYGNELGLDLADYPWLRCSAGPVPYEDLPKLISSADVGLVLYRNADTVWQGDNMTYVGLSSGKLAQYLQCGVPVAVLAFPGLCDLVERYHCGICVENVSQLQEAITTILANYCYYSDGAITSFQEVFAFESHFDAVLERLAHAIPEP